MWNGLKNTYNRVVKYFTIKKTFNNLLPSYVNIYKFSVFVALSFFIFSFFAVFFILSDYLHLVFLKNLAIWCVFFFLVYWVCAAVWCLYDKDDYGRNVSASDDFYNVAFTSLWLIEGFLLSLFVSYTKLFDYYEPFIESEDREASYRSEDADDTTLWTALFAVLSIQYVLYVLDGLASWEAKNPYTLAVFLFTVVAWLVLAFVIISVKFLEEFDFEEDGEDLFDETEMVLDHEDFPEEGVDGGDYREGYEILQMFFSYWHYMFIVLHVLFLVYSTVISKGKQNYVHWAVVAICQNMVLLSLLDLFDWFEVLANWDTIDLDTTFSWFYIEENPITSLKFYVNQMWQSVEWFFYQKSNLDAQQITEEELVLEEYTKITK